LTIKTELPVSFWWGKCEDISPYFTQGNLRRW
jgi:hypothetical protein